MLKFQLQECTLSDVGRMTKYQQLGNLIALHTLLVTYTCNM